MNKIIFIDKQRDIESLEGDISTGNYDAYDVGDEVFEYYNIIKGVLSDINKYCVNW